MNNLLPRILHWWQGAFRPWQHTWLEGILMRLAVAAGMFSWWQTRYHPGFKQLDEPTGLAHFFDLGWLNDPTAYGIVHGCVLGGLIGYLLGGFWPLLRWRGRDWLTPIALLIVALSHILIQTNLNSNGATFHGSLALALVICAQTIVHWLALFRHQPSQPRLRWENWAIYYSILTLAASYTTSAITKMNLSGLGWMTRSHYVVVQMVRTGEEDFLNKLEDEKHGKLDYWIEQFTAHPNLVRAGLTGAWFVEFLAFLALLGRRSALLAGLAIIGLHRGIAITMALYFPLNELLVLAFLVNLPYWLCVRWRRPVME